MKVGIVRHMKFRHVQLKYEHPELNLAKNSMRWLINGYGQRNTKSSPAPWHHSKKYSKFSDRSAKHCRRLLHMNWVPVGNPSSTDAKLCNYGWRLKLKVKKTQATIQVNMVSTKTIQIQLININININNNNNNNTHQQQQQQQQHVDHAFHWATTSPHSSSPHLWPKTKTHEPCVGIEIVRSSCLEDFGVSRGPLSLAHRYA